MSISWHYKRPKLAEQITQQITGGLFSRIAYLGQRRIGKTAFIQNDLIPELVKQDCFPIYISMWANKEAPHREITRQMTNALAALNDKKKVKSFLNTEVAKLNFAGFGVEFAKLQPSQIQPDELTIISDLFEDLCNKPSKRIVFLFDEIQHLVTREEFSPLIYTLRTLLDVAGDKISVLYTGSSRRGINAMFSNAEMPFYHSANLVEFPKLDHDYVKAQAKLLESQYNLKYSDEQMFQFFEHIDRNAFWFDQLIRYLALNKSSLDEAIKMIQSMIFQEKDHQRLMDSCSDLAICILSRISKNLSRYDESAKEFYKSVGIQSATRGKIQSTLNTLIKSELIIKVSSDLYLNDAFDGLSEQIEAEIEKRRAAQNPQ